jgi:coenzyme F420-reducing hydrogenase delta subunit
MAATVEPELENFAIKIKIVNCGECVFCVSVCPFEALSIVEETKKVKVDTDKCKLCGLCYAICPSGLIDIEYYNVEVLGEYIQKKVGELGADEVTIACRGTGLTAENWRERTDNTAEDGEDKTLFFTLPCLGRINLNFLVQSYEYGIQKINLFACEEDFCRYKEGSKVMANKFGATQLLLEDMGYEMDQISFAQVAPKASIEENKCIACGTCAFVCPYEAIRIEESARLDTEKCMGCGQCVPSCPANAISIEGWEFDRIGKQITDFAGVSASEPKVLILGCQWSDFAAGDEENKLPENVRFLRMPCSGRVDTLHILRALSAGIDGVLVAACLDDQCNLETGNKRTRSRIDKLKTNLETLGISDRVLIFNTHSKYLGMFDEHVNKFTEKLKELGPSPAGRGA